MSLTLPDLQATVGRPILAAAAFQAAGRLKAGCRHECPPHKKHAESCAFANILPHNGLAVEFCRG
jgi:hypothetical protein